LSYFSWLIACLRTGVRQNEDQYAPRTSAEQPDEVVQPKKEKMEEVECDLRPNAAVELAVPQNLPAGPCTPMSNRVKVSKRWIRQMYYGVIL